MVVTDSGRVAKREIRRAMGAFIVAGTRGNDPFSGFYAANGGSGPAG